MKKVSSQRNHIFDCLPARDLDEILGPARTVELQAGESLQEPGQPTEIIYFPETAVVSYLGNAGQGITAEVWSVGAEGIAGISGILSTTCPFRAIVQIPGTAKAINRSTVVRLFSVGGALHDHILKYYQRLLVQAAQLGVCNQMHAVEQRFSRWLLMLLDRSGEFNLRMTQTLIAGALGTRRATISIAAAALQNARLISYTPGSITINSRRGLQAATCGCYKLIKAEFDAA
jgi:CRP-like cAMP-binding protein